MTPSTRNAANKGERRSRQSRGRGFRSVAGIAIFGVVAPVCAAAVVASAADPGTSVPTAENVPTQQAVPLPGQAAAPAEEATRQQLDQYFDELQVVVDSQQTTGQDSPANDMSAAVEIARSLIDDLDGVQLRAMGDVIAANPNWSEQPAVLQEAVGASPVVTSAAGPNDLLMEYNAPESLMRLSLDGASASVQSAAHDAAVALAPRPALALRAAGDPEGFLSNCQGPAANVRGLFYGYWIAAQVAGAAGAVASGIPDSL